MRWQGLLGCVLLIAFLAGCAGDPEEVHDECHTADDHDACHAMLECEAALGAAGAAGDAANATADNATADNATGEASTPSADCPAEGAELNATTPPAPLLTMAAADGTPINGTSILEGETITFSAEGSVAEAGLQALALTVQEPNGTTTVSLYEDGAFQDATLTFPRAGIVNATLRALDEAGVSGAVTAQAFVDRASSGSEGGKHYIPDSSGCSARVNADSQAPLVGNYFVHKQSFHVGAGVKWVSVEADGTQSVAICAPGGDRIDSESSGGSAATDEGDWEPSTQYYVALHPDGPQSTMEWTIVVHYGPKTA